MSGDDHGHTDEARISTLRSWLLDWCRLRFDTGDSNEPRWDEPAEEVR
jgi:hypothetical protein